jgi:hypothetical protein
MAIDQKINNPDAVNTFSNETVWNHGCGTIAFNNKTGSENMSFAHRSGANLTFSNQTTSEFNPNQKQTNTLGNNYNTVKGDNFHTSMKDKEDRVIGNYTVITGAASLLNSPIASKYIEIQSEIAGHKVSPEISTGGVANNTGAVYKMDGTPDPKTSSTAKGTFKPTPSHQNMQKIIEGKEKELATYAASMGEGGNIKMLSCKHVYIQAGTVGCTFDSGLTNPAGRIAKKETTYDVKQGYKGTPEQVEIAVPSFEEKDTASTVPFGEVTINAMNSFKVQTGAGGVDFKSTGSLRLVSSGLTTVAGSQVMIGGAGNGGGSVYIKGDYTEVKGEAAINIISPTTHIDSKVTISKDTVIEGNLIVKGSIVALGNIFCAGTITSSGTITSDSGDVIATGVSLINHTHGGVEAGPGDTGPPN